MRQGVLGPIFLHRFGIVESHLGARKAGDPRKRGKLASFDK